MRPLPRPPSPSKACSDESDGLDHLTDGVNIIFIVVVSSETVMPASSSNRKKAPPSRANESAEDFVEVEPKRKPRPTQRGGDSAAAVRHKKLQPQQGAAIGPNLAASLDVVDGLPDCPICGKRFSRPQQQQRTSHLKSCGASRGLSAGQLVKVRQLEERQAEERKALGLPAVPPKIAPGAGAVAIGLNAERESSRHGTKSRKNSTSAGDPRLEMALALSASLAQSKADAEEEAQKKESETLGIASYGEGPSMCRETARPPEVILPNAAAWPIRMPASGGDPRPKKGFKNTKAKTQLQVRTEEERNRVLSERVAVILTSDECGGVVGGAFALAQRQPMKESLRGAFRGECRLWKVASAKVGNFILDIMEPYAKFKSRPEVAGNSGPKRAAEGPPDRDEGRVSRVDDVGPSWLSLLKSGEKSDVVVFCKGEREIRCHSLVLLARCRAVLRDVIAANNAEGEDESMIAWNESRPEAVRAFLEYLYCGRVGAIASKPALEDLRALAKKYSVDSAVDLQLGGVDRGVLLSDSGSESESGDATDTAAMKNGFTQPAVSDDDDEGETEPPENLDYLLSAFSDGVSQEREEEEEEEEEERNGTDEEPCGYEDAGCGFETDEDLFGCENSSVTESIVVVSERAETSEHVDKLPSLVLGNDEMHELSPIKSQNENSGLHDNERESETEDLPSIPESYVGSAEKSAGRENEFDIWDGFDPQGGDMFEGGGEDGASRAALMNKRPSPLPGPSRATTPPPSFRTQQAAAASTPKHRVRHRQAHSQSDAVTPKPDFAGMLSPALRKELDRFGLKVIPRRKAIPLLEHIYEETHPIVEEGERERGGEERSRENSEGSDCSSDGEDFPEESMMHKYDDDEEDHGGGDATAATLAIRPTQTERTLSERVKDFIRGDPSLHKEVLLYEPIWFESFVADFKEKTGLGRKCKAAEVADVLDAECVTFRTSASTARRRRKKSPRKKSPKKQKRKAAAAAPVTSAGEKSPKRRRADQARACHN